MAAALALLAALALPGPPPLVVGLLLPPEEAQAAAIRDGATLAVLEAGTGVRLAVRGRSGPWGSDASEAALLVSEDGAQALLAPPDGAASHLVLQVAGRTGVPVASLCADTSVTAAGVTWAVRTVPSTRDEALALFAALRPALRYALVVPAGRAGVQISTDIAAAARLAGAEVVDSITVGPRTAVPQLALRPESRPDAVLLWLDPIAAGRAARALRAGGFPGPLAGPGRLQCAALVAEARDAVDGLVLVAPAGTAAASLRFAAAFRRHFDHEPDVMAAMAHDATELLVELLRRQGGTEAARRAFPLEGPSAVPGNPLSFDRRGNRITAFEVRLARGGRFGPRPEPEASERIPAPESPSEGHR